MSLDIHRLRIELQKENFDKEYVNKVVLYADNLNNRGVPVIFDKQHLSMYLKVNTTSLSQIIGNSFIYYKQKKIPKKYGKPRNIHIPSIELKKIQKFILNEILTSIEVSKHAKGFKPGCSIKDNATPHIKQDYILNIDLKDFFSNIKINQVKKVFLDIGYNSEVSEALANLTTVKGFLPQGSCTSPYLSNLVCRNLDTKLFDYASNKKLNYSRYADDITFSGGKEVKEILNQIYKIIEIEGFKINLRKTRLISSNKRQEVTGLVVNSKVNISREFIKELRMEIYFCKKYGVNGHISRKNITYSNFKYHLFGKAYYIKMINKQKGEKFLKDLNEINWEY